MSKCQFDFKRKSTRDTVVSVAPFLVLLGCQSPADSRDSSGASSAGKTSGSAGSASTPLGNGGSSGNPAGGADRAGAPSGGSSAAGGVRGEAGARAAGGTPDFGGRSAAGGEGELGGASGGTTAGASGAVIVPLGSCRGVQVTGDIVSATPPVVLAATLRSSGETAEYGSVSIAPTSDDTAYVAFRSSELLAKLAPDGVSTVASGVCGDTLKLLVADDGALRLFATTSEAVTDAETDTFFSLFTPAVPAWSPNFIVGGKGFDAGAYGYFDGYRGYDAVLGTAGRAHALARRYAAGSSIDLSLFDGTAGGGWTPKAGLGNPLAGIAVDSLGRTRIVTIDAAPHLSDVYDYSDWTEGNVLANFREEGPLDPSDLKLAIAPGLAGSLGITRFTKDSLVFTSSDGASVADDQVLPDTPPAAYGVDPCYTRLSSCQPVVCEGDEVQPPNVALTSTSDGVFWLAYTHVHYRDEYTTNGGSTSDCWTLSASTTMRELRLVRLSGDGSAPPSVRWTQPGADVIAVAARGSRLFLAAYDGDAGVVRLFVLDSSEL